MSSRPACLIACGILLSALSAGEARAQSGSSTLQVSARLIRLDREMEALGSALSAARLGHAERAPRAGPGRLFTLRTELRRAGPLPPGRLGLGPLARRPIRVGPDTLIVDIIYGAN